MAEINQKHRAREKSLLIIYTGETPGTKSRWEVCRQTWRDKKTSSPGIFSPSK